MVINVLLPSVRTRHLCSQEETGEISPLLQNWC